MQKSGFLTTWLIYSFELKDMYRNDPKFSDRLVWAKVQTKIRLLIEEQSDQGLHCLLFHLNLFDEIPQGLASLFEF